MGRPRTPTNILELRGAFARHGDRKKARENEPRNLPPIDTVAPDSFSDAEKQAWDDLIRYAPAGVLTAADTVGLELASGLLAANRTKGLPPAHLGQLIALLGKFGMTPSDRSKVSAQAVKPKSQWSAFGK
jgi:hypothetical protein